MVWRAFGRALASMLALAACGGAADGEAEAARGAAEDGRRPPTARVRRGGNRGDGGESRGAAGESNGGPRGAAGAKEPALPGASHDEAAATAMPRPAPLHREGDAVALNDGCVACHRDIADEWEASLHRDAYTSREFQRALRNEPLPFCRGCHAPEADPRRPEPALAAIGVACVSCHVPQGEAVLSALPAQAPREAPHAVARDPAFAGAGACATCHEFAFPDRRPTPEFMQTTVREHQASPQADHSCAACHMPRAADGHRTHGFRASRDADWMREVLIIGATRPTGDRVEVTLDLHDERLGHAFPTGDLLRRLTVEVAVDDRRRRDQTQRRYLARHWEHRRLSAGMHVRTLARDDRLQIGEPPRVLAFTLDPADAALPVRWSVRYERVESFVGPGEDGAVVVGGLELAGGTLPGSG